MAMKHVRRENHIRTIKNALEKPKERFAQKDNYNRSLAEAMESGPSYQLTLQASGCYDKMTWHLTEWELMHCCAVTIATINNTVPRFGDHSPYFLTLERGSERRKLTLDPECIYDDTALITLIRDAASDI
jgi:hypothetical protein